MFCFLAIVFITPLQSMVTSRSENGHIPLSELANKLKGETFHVLSFTFNFEHEKLYTIQKLPQNTGVTGEVRAG
ncbi:hypothetical protein B0J18DRAFT_439892 [Chaetomium sp. MPI-SDFR-AT-0129]|nr:hypothetical protein B0J18DRAFT_439892 [Chaetomium sp. MPI-SDFR-AT-0129]